MEFLYGHTIGTPSPIAILKSNFQRVLSRYLGDAYPDHSYAAYNRDPTFYYYAGTWGETLNPKP